MKERPMGIYQRQRLMGTESVGVGAHLEECVGMTHEQLQDAHIAALREIVEQRAEIERLQAQLATAKGEVWDLVIDELQDRWDIESPYLDERVRILRGWCKKQKEAL